MQLEEDKIYGSFIVVFLLSALQILSNSIL